MRTKTANALAKHVKTWSKCTNCELGHHATNHVLYDGSVPAKYLFIGEAPGDTEDLTGTPFIGPAGKVLREMIKEVGLRKQDYCITNVIACFPYKEDDPTAFRPPKRDEALACQPRLRELFTLCKPKLVILLGEAAKKFCPFIQLRDDDPPVIYLRHPSFILRNGGIGSVEFKRNMLKLREAINEPSKKAKTNTEKQRRLLESIKNQTEIFSKKQEDSRQAKKR